MERFRRALRLSWAAVGSVVGVAVGYLTNLVTSGSPSWPIVAGFVTAAATTTGLTVRQAITDEQRERVERREERARVLAPFDPSSERVGTPTVVSVLDAGAALAPFVGRSDEQRELRAWCADPEGVWVRVMDGPSGVGKSRLATEVARQLIKEKWAAGRAVRGRLAEVMAAVVACGDPTLIVVDDADTQPEVAELLRDVECHGGEPRVRVLLVARDAPAFTTWLAARLPEELVRGWPSMRVEVIGAGGDRRRWFVQAVRAYAQALGRGPVLVTEFDIGPVGTDGEPMMVTQLRAALAAEQGGSRAAIDTVRTLGTAELAAKLVEHEQRRWSAAAADPEWGLTSGALTAAVRQEAVLALVLLGPQDEKDAVGVLQRLRLLRDQLEIVLSNVVGWAHYLYPGPAAGRSGLVAPAPEFLSGALIATCVETRHQELVAALDLAAAATRDPQLVVRMIRAAALFPAASVLVGAVLTRNPTLRPR